MDGFSGIVSFEVKAGPSEARRVLTRLPIFKIAESLGGVESLVELPAVMTHASIPKEDRQKSGLDDGLIRLSVGIEDEKDLIADLDQAMGAQSPKKLISYETADAAKPKPKHPEHSPRSTRRSQR